MSRDTCRRDTSGRASLFTMIHIGTSTGVPEGFFMVRFEPYIEEGYTVQYLYLLYSKSAYSKNTLQQV